MKLKLVTWILLIISGCLLGQSNDTVIVLPEVELDYVVLSNDTLDDLYSTGVSHSIDYRSIQEENSTSLVHVLRKVPGVYVKNYGGLGGLKSISVRGLGGQHTGISLNNNLLTDQKSGQVDLSAISTLGVSAVHFNIGSVRNTTSPAKTYSYNNTLCFEEDPIAFLENKNRKIIGGVGFGSFESYSPNLNLFSKMGDSSALSVVYEGVFSQGDFPYQVTENDTVKEYRRDNAGFKRNVFKANWVTNRSKYDLKVTGLIRKASQELPGAVILYNPFSGQHSEVDQTTFLASFKTKDLKINKIIRVSFNTEESNYTDEYFENSAGGISNFYEQYASLTSFGLNKKIKDIELFFVTDLEFAELLTNVVEGVPKRLGNYSVLGMKYLKGRFQVEANLLHTIVNDKSSEHDEVFQKTTGYAGGNYQLLKGRDIYMRLGYKSSYRLPTFSDLYYNNIGNKELDPELSKQVNIGLNGVFKGKWVNQFYYSINAYYGEIEDKIIAVPTQNLFVWSMQNIGKVNNYGIEVNGVYKSLPIKGDGRVDLNYSYSLQFVRDITEEGTTVYQQQIAYTPHELINIRLTPHLNKRLSFYWNLQFIGHQFYLPENIYENLIDEVALHEVGVNYQSLIARKVKVTCQVSVRNLTDEQYQLVRSFPMQGRSFWSSLIFTI